MKSDSPLKMAVICMVHNGYEYLAEFLAYHLNLCDHIYLIDHNSDRDLRRLNIPHVTVIRSNHEAQFQSECTNRVIEHFDIKKNYDWLFVLDIDEFLPFKERSEFHRFFRAHKKYDVVQFHWRNGVPFYDSEKETPESLIDCPGIRFFRHRGQQFKSFVNIRKTKGQFYVPTGAHQIHRIFSFWRARTPILKRRKVLPSAVSSLELYHVVAFNKDAFVKKIKNYVRQMEYREHVAGQSGWVVREYPDDYAGDEWLWYIGNFRVSDPQKQCQVKRKDFIETPIFDHLDRNEVYSLRKVILECPECKKHEPTPEEQAYLSAKEDDRKVIQNISWFSISNDHEIVNVIPKAAA